LIIIKAQCIPSRFFPKNINVKQLVSNLESKSILKRGKFIKAGLRTVESWMKILPNPESDEEFKNFKQNLFYFYQIDLSKYLDWYETGDLNKLVLSDAGEQLLGIQRRWVPHLREKLGIFVDEDAFSREYCL
jgi:hypothetical protein